MGRNEVYATRCGNKFGGFFLSFRERLISQYDTLFERTGEGQDFSAVGNFSAKWGWYQSIFALSQGDIRRYDDITKMNIHKCLYALSFIKEKDEVEAKQIKNKFNK